MYSVHRSQCNEAKNERWRIIRLLRYYKNTISKRESSFQGRLDLGSIWVRLKSSAWLCLFDRSKLEGWRFSTVQVFSSYHSYCVHDGVHVSLECSMLVTSQKLKSTLGSKHDWLVYLLHVVGKLWCQNVLYWSLSVSTCKHWISEIKTA